MTTKEAVTAAMYQGELTRYGLAQVVGATPPSVHQWLRNTRMSKAYAKKFLDLFNIKVTDAV